LSLADAMAAIPRLIVANRQDDLIAYLGFII